MRNIGIHYLRKKLSDIIRSVEHGHDYRLTRNGKPLNVAMVLLDSECLDRAGEPRFDDRAVSEAMAEKAGS